MLKLKFSKIKHVLKKIWFKSISLICRIVPLKNIVIFDSFYGRGLSDDPKFIALELLRRGTKARLFWLVNMQDSVKLPIGLEPLPIGTLRSIFYISISKVWVDNCRGNFDMVVKRKGQYYIQTWHATLGLKKVGTANQKSSKGARALSKRDAKMTDLMYSNNDFYCDLYRNRFWYNGVVKKCDQPRVANLMNPPKNIKQMVFKSLGINEDAKIALYAPTFRDHNLNDINVYEFDFQRIKSALETRFGGKYVILIRLHPNLRHNPIVQQMVAGNDIVNATSYPDMGELLCVSDILFTDYSSSMFDCSIARVPVILVAKDYQCYTSEDRELEFDPKTELPFLMCESEDELINAISGFNIDVYKKKCDDFYNSVGLIDEGRGDKVLADIVESKLNEVS